jgi:hypothetical protein
MARAAQDKIAFAVVYPGVIIPSSKLHIIFQSLPGSPLQVSA